MMMVQDVSPCYLLNVTWHNIPRMEEFTEQAKQP